MFRRIKRAFIDALGLFLAMMIFYPLLDLIRDKVINGQEFEYSFAEHVMIAFFVAVLDFLVLMLHENLRDGKKKKKIDKVKE